MSVYTDIVNWSKGLPSWQRDALRRLATQPALSATDIDELAEACLEEANQRPASKPMIPIDSSHVPAVRSGGREVAITGIARCQSLNRISDGQMLTFGPTGLTIVYGDNGAGKSGFARVIRQVCRARGAAGEVLSDVYAAQQDKPQATVQYAVGGTERSFGWSQGATPPEDLRAIAVFDTVADAAFVEDENEIFWTPSGLDLLIRLPKVIDQVRDRLEKKVLAISAQGPLPPIAPGTVVATFLAQLTANTTAAVIDGHMPKPDDVKDLKSIEATLGTPDPATEATRIRQQATRLGTLRDRVVLLEGRLGQAGIDVLANLHATYRASVDAEAILATDTLKDSLVPGVGGPEWRALWTAAEAFAVSGATSDGAFPSEEVPGRCVLCQQQLDDSARARLDRFHEFVRSDLAQKRKVADESLRMKIEAIRQLRTSEPGDKGLLGELGGPDEQNASNLAAFLAGAEEARSAIIALVPDEKDWHLPEPLPDGWSAWLGEIMEDAEKRAKAMQDAAKPGQRVALQIQRNEIAARQAFSKDRALVEAEVKRLASRAELDKAVAACNTQGISRKAGELARTRASDPLMNAFTEEAQDLKVPVQVTYSYSGNDKGTSYQRLALRTAEWSAAGPKQVLSEGERRSVALAAFIAELEVRGDLSAVVFDDPVCSLDHERRELVAHRLASLAARRQVVVFTHDLVFHHTLRAAAEQDGVEIAEREVARMGAVLGLCRNKPPRKAMHTKSLIGELNELHQKCAVVHGAQRIDEYEDMVKNAFGLLRDTWEVAVEDLLLNGAVRRLDPCVHTQQLEPLHDICKSDLTEVEAGMTECSNWVHRMALAINRTLPDPSALRAEIDRLVRFRAHIQQRRRN